DARAPTADLVLKQDHVRQPSRQLPGEFVPSTTDGAATRRLPEQRALVLADALTAPASAGELRVCGDFVPVAGKEIGLGVVNPRSDRVESVEEICSAATRTLRY